MMTLSVVLFLMTESKSWLEISKPFSEYSPVNSNYDNPVEPSAKSTSMDIAEHLGKIQNGIGKHALGVLLSS